MRYDSPDSSLGPARYSRRDDSSIVDSASSSAPSTRGDVDSSSYASPPSPPLLHHRRLLSHFNIIIPPFLPISLPPISFKPHKRLVTHGD